ncbi:MAG: ubiquinone biosynthesis regulatory protein kinase UbiB [Proteobacteria bacterium]|nr:ubiquinone biosynthesis regulatory protein kinase UbiB [Pseudomonadota bacterium]
MKRITQFFRLLQINIVLMRYAFTPQVVGTRYPLVRFLAYVNPWRALTKKGQSRAESIRLALESLGPIFVKFGQLLSTRRDLLPDDIANELALLQDQVPPFPSWQARKAIELALGNKIEALFASFDDVPLASASIAQVHAAILPEGASVVVKILRPKIVNIIQHDIALLYMAARLTERFWSQGKRLHAVELVAEFESSIVDELDLQREAANSSQLRRNFLYSDQLYVPKVYWEYVQTNVLVMERIHGIRISNTVALKERNCNLKQLAENGVEMFFTQVFRDNFFHADMHPGNLFVDCSTPENPKILVVDFGIVGSLSPSDSHYLAQNLLAFLNRDYRQVAVLHVESGWLPPKTRIDQFEAAIRTVCEPILEQPLRDISFGQLLLRLFTTAERFNMEVQPQLLLLQKTLLSIEGLGRQLYPNLDIWATAKPFMEKWIKEQRGLKNLTKRIYLDAYDNIEKLLKSPKLIFSILEHTHERQRLSWDDWAEQNQKISQNHRRYYTAGAATVLLLLALLDTFSGKTIFVHHVWWLWLTGGFLALLAWIW